LHQQDGQHPILFFYTLAMLPSWQKDKYSLVEREKRFLLATLPGGIDKTFRIIEDVYFPDTHLRLRKVTDQLGRVLELKLTQKFLAPGQGATERSITTLYLNQTEYDMLAGLSGHHLRKRRYSYKASSHPYSIDVFEGHLAGLLLAEVDYSQNEPTPTLPAFALEDVTHDLFFTGGHLAALSEKDFLEGFQRRIL
jgi:CYTH domain-containing protein